jgi:hypothetical protein
VRTSQRAARWLSGSAIRVLEAADDVGTLSLRPSTNVEDSAWLVRSSQPVEAYRQQDVDPAPSPGDALDRFAMHPDRPWALVLRPILRVLGAVEDPGSAVRQPPAHSYTLY